MVLGILCFVMSGMTLIKKAEIMIKAPANVKTTGDSLRIFISPIISPVIAPNLATPEQIPLQVIRYFLGKVSGVITQINSNEAVPQSEVRCAKNTSPLMGEDKLSYFSLSMVWGSIETMIK